MEKKSKKKTEKRIKRFRKSVKKYIDFFGLYEYRLHLMPQAKASARASCYWHNIEEAPDGSGMTITICYSESWINNPNLDNKDIDQTAFHEVLELLLHKLRDYAQQHRVFISDREIDDEIHRIIRRFENKILPLINKCKSRS